jgi:hypothetical protein
MGVRDRPKQQAKKKPPLVRRLGALKKANNNFCNSKTQSD